MRILVSSFTFPPQASGVSEIARAQACGLAARGHEVTVATEFDPRRTEAHSFGCLTVRQFKVGGSYDPRFGYDGDIAGYQEFVTGGAFDGLLFNCWQVWATDLAAQVFHRTKARKIIVSQGLDAHLWHPNRRFPWGLGQWIRCLSYVAGLRRVMDTFDQVVFLSRRKDFGRYFDHWLAGNKPNVSIIPNGIHLDDLRRRELDFRQAYGVTSPRLLLNVANYCHRKNQIATLRAFLRARRADATLVFIGSEFNEYSAELRRLHDAARDRVGRVLFLQEIPKSHINAAYQAADVFILNSREETQPLVILDAMASGIPFVSTNTGCVAELPGGLIVRGEAATARALQTLLEDAGLRRRLGEAGRAEAEARYSWDKVITALEALFQRLLESR